MKLFGLPAPTYFRALWSGRIGHWAGTNDAVMSEAFKRVETLQDPLRLIFREFLLASNSAAEHLVGYQRNIRLLTLEQKALSIHHFRQLYSTLLSYFAAVCYAVNPFLKESLVGELPRVAPNGQVVEKYLRDARIKEQEYGDDHSPWLGTSYTEALATLAWQHLAEGFPGVNVEDTTGLTGFKLVVSQEAIVSLGRIKAQMQSPDATTRPLFQHCGATARPTTVACWSCKGQLEVTPETAGKKVRCAQCGTRQALPR